jgi:hypothetical protein
MKYAGRGAVFTDEQTRRWFERQVRTVGDYGGDDAPSALVRGVGRLWPAVSSELGEKFTQ